LITSLSLAERLTQLQTLWLDIDGTLTSIGGVVEPETLLILKKLSEKFNFKIGLVTGRAQCLIQYLIDQIQEHQIPVSGYLLEHGGTCLSPELESVWQNSFSHEEKVALSQHLGWENLTFFHSQGLYHLFSPFQEDLDWFQEKFGSKCTGIATSEKDSLLRQLYLSSDVSIIRTRKDGSLYPTGCEIGNLSFLPPPRFNTKSTYQWWEIYSKDTRKVDAIQHHVSQMGLTDFSSVGIVGNELPDLEVMGIPNLGLSVYIGTPYTIQPHFILESPEELITLLNGQL
jgi:hydroxymethylpyrimidine pyrophosphatase-like HAD family hydrolase